MIAGNLQKFMRICLYVLVFALLGRVRAHVFCYSKQQHSLPSSLLLAIVYLHVTP